MTSKKLLVQSDSFLPQDSPSVKLETTTMQMGFHHFTVVYILDGFTFETPSHQALKDVSRPQLTHLGPLGGTTKDRGFRRSKARRKFCSKSTIMDWAGRWMDGCESRLVGCKIMNYENYFKR